QALPPKRRRWRGHRVRCAKSTWHCASYERAARIVVIATGFGALLQGRPDALCKVSQFRLSAVNDGPEKVLVAVRVRRSCRCECTGSVSTRHRRLSQRRLRTDRHCAPARAAALREVEPETPHGKPVRPTLRP